MTIHLTLFGKLQISCNDEPATDLIPGKAQELLCYLMLHRDASHYREKLAELLWPDASANLARKYLRKALWQLQNYLPAGCQDEQHPLLLVDADWVAVNREARFVLDVAEFEVAEQAGRDQSGAELSSALLARLQAAVDLYRGDLLEGWYEDWCLFERQRLQDLQIELLSKLLSYCEARALAGQGIAYATRILRFDRAHEQTHRRLMRLHYRAGDRTAALRQFQQCREILHEELGVAPAQRTVELYEQMRNDARPDELFQSRSYFRPETLLAAGRLRELHKVQSLLEQLQEQVQQQISTTN